MDDLIDGTLDGWPVSLMIERDGGGKIYGGHCCTYTNDNDESASDKIVDLCSAITESTYGMTSRTKILTKAKQMGFIED